ncbi:MAG: phytanoyl-CoA dioxygenase family protein [Candidatus Latescibacteria bacterium]|nr:phytanoyl-CoA dioxygenase family protein [Candidatus Latescibacterota bacterium]
MTEAEIYEFDLNGYIIYRDLISPEDVRRMNAIIDAHQAGKFPHNSSLLELDPCFMELMAHPRTLQIIRVMIGDWLRLDHAYILQMTKTTEIRENLHGGSRANYGEHQYQWVAGRMYNGMIVVIYALEDVNPGDGGFICVPGSHKANLSYHPDVYSHLVVNPSLKAGDMLILTEALVHGTRLWRSDYRRRKLIYKYSPGHSTCVDYDSIKHYRDLATNDLQRDILRPPGAGGRSPLKFPEIVG